MSFSLVSVKRTLPVMPFSDRIVMACSTNFVGIFPATSVDFAQATTSSTEELSSALTAVMAGEAASSGEAATRQRARKHRNHERRYLTCCCISCGSEMAAQTQIRSDTGFCNEHVRSCRREYSFRNGCPHRSGGRASGGNNGRLKYNQISPRKKA